MNLDDILTRAIPPQPWSEGGKIPWEDPAFSQRMLREHLIQSHDLASRRSEIIDRHVDWIHQTLLGGNPGLVLDLGCGPGLYTSRLAALGHSCVGIDFSPASIEYAQQQATQHSDSTTYIQGDIRDVDYGTGYNVVMLIFGELNMFTRDDALHILQKARGSLVRNGRLLLEPHTYEFVQAMGQAGSTWRTSEHGIFSDQPHLILQEHFWDNQMQASTSRTYIVDAETSVVDQYVETAQAYTLEAYTLLLEEAGFVLRDSFSALSGSPQTGEFMALVAEPA
jgi:SAM-dependent methyltransferase